MGKKFGRQKKIKTGDNFFFRTVHEGSKTDRNFTLHFFLCITMIANISTENYIYIFDISTTEKAKLPLKSFSLCKQKSESVDWKNFPLINMARKNCYNFWTFVFVGRKVCRHFFLKQKKFLKKSYTVL